MATVQKAFNPFADRAGHPGKQSVFTALSEAIENLDRNKPSNQTVEGAKALAEVRQALLHTGGALKSVAAIGFATPAFWEELDGRYKKMKAGLEQQNYPCPGEVALAVTVEYTMRDMRRIPEEEAGKAIRNRAAAARQVHSGNDASMDAYNDAIAASKTQQQRLALYDSAVKQAHQAQQTISLNAGKFVRFEDSALTAAPITKLADMLPVAANKNVRAPGVAA